MTDITDFFAAQSPTPIVYLTTINHKRIYLKQDYLNHPIIQGNKLRKLKYLLLAAKSSRQTLISFGGAYSNHIAALAAAGQLFSLPTVGIIRGQELAATSRWGYALKTAAQHGMQLHFVSRQAYRAKQANPEIQSIIRQYPQSMLIPEGGSNQLAVMGCKEIMTEIAANSLENSMENSATNFQAIFAACGTGGTLAGLIDGVAEQQLPMRVVGVAVLKAALNDSILQLSQAHQTVDWQINNDYHFSGYAKSTPALIDFQQQFEQQFSLPLDAVYTAKLCYAVFDLAAKSISPQRENWLIYHSGGLQGATSA